MRDPGRWTRVVATVGAVGLLGGAGAPAQEALPSGPSHTNSLGMRLVRIEPGRFRMGSPHDPALPRNLLVDPHFREGDFDEQPAHDVTISRAFLLAEREVTNAQYEEFDASHRELRGKLGFSTGDDEAVVFVSWQDAAAFVRWLSEKEGRPYRLPTEAEWEYACRAGTQTPFHTGDALPAYFLRNVGRSGVPALPREGEAIPALAVGRTPPNPWGLQDMHGNVEEWVHDWYGPYAPEHQVDPVGRRRGEFRVTRGGSHSTDLYYLRSANRSGTLPEDRTWMIGFRVALGPLPATEPLPPAPLPLHQRNVSQEVPEGLERGPDPSQAHFAGPRRYVKVPPDSYGPMFSSHNHDPAIAECPNGDLLAIWYSTFEERGREVAVLGSRLRYGAEEWEPASPFWDAPDRNDHTPALWFDGDETLYFFIGVSTAATWGNLAIVLRTSDDNGATWSTPRFIVPEHGSRTMPEESVFRMRDGRIVLSVDAIDSRFRGTSVWLSGDDGETWSDPGGTIPGIHAAIAEGSDGQLIAFSREHTVHGQMPKCLSPDAGGSWECTASPFPRIAGGQRPVMLRLREGPLFFASFAKERTIEDAAGRERTVSGLFGALSYDDGETWPVERLITDDGSARVLAGGAWTGGFTMSHSRAEPRGYLSVTQTPDGVIHLISSALHYELNRRWLETPAPPLAKGED